jgi:hypothetical protein
LTKSVGQRRFDERRQKCSPTILEVLDFLMTVAENAGPDVELPPTPELKGEGVKYRNGSGQFCVLHLREKLVWARIDHDRAARAALVADLKAARLAFTREQKDGPWLKIPNMQDAVRVVSFIVQAYDDRAGR